MKLTKKQELIKELIKPIVLGINNLNESEDVVANTTRCKITFDNVNKNFTMSVGKTVIPNLKMVDLIDIMKSAKTALEYVGKLDKNFNPRQLK